MELLNLNSILDIENMEEGYKKELSLSERENTRKNIFSLKYEYADFYIHMPEGKKKIAFNFDGKEEKVKLGTIDLILKGLGSNGYYDTYITDEKDLLFRIYRAKEDENVSEKGEHRYIDITARAYNEKGERFVFSKSFRGVGYAPFVNLSERDIDVMRCGRIKKKILKNIFLK